MDPIKFMQNTRGRTVKLQREKIVPPPHSSGEETLFFEKRMLHGSHIVLPCNIVTDEGTGLCDHLGQTLSVSVYVDQFDLDFGAFEAKTEPMMDWIMGQIHIQFDKYLVGRRFELQAAQDSKWHYAEEYFHAKVIPRDDREIEMVQRGRYSVLHWSTFFEKGSPERREAHRLFGTYFREKKMDVAV